MKTVEIDKDEALLKYVQELLKERVLVLTDNKQPVAAIVSLDAEDQESLALSINAEFLEIIEKARNELAQGRMLSLEDMKIEMKSRK